MKTNRITKAQAYGHCANMRKPPLGYGLLKWEVLTYRTKRLDYWRNKIGEGLFTEDVRIKADNDVVDKYGPPTMVWTPNGYVKG